MTERTDLVDMGSGLYAVRRTCTKFGIFKTIDFLELDSSIPSWKTRDNKFFQNCVTSDIDKAKRYLATFGRGNGVEVVDGVLTGSELSAMSNFALTNEPVRELLMKAKELWILSK